MKGVGTETATVGDVAKAVGEIATEAMSEVGESAETTAEKFARSRATMDKWKMAIGRFVNDAVNGFASVISKVDELINKVAKVAATNYRTGGEKLSAMLVSLLKLNPLFNIDESKTDLDSLNKELEGIQNTAKNISDDWFRRLGNNLKDFKGKADDAMQYLKDKRYELVVQLGEFEGKDPAKMTGAEGSIRINSSKI